KGNECDEKDGGEGPSPRAIALHTLAPRTRKASIRCALIHPITSSSKNEEHDMPTAGVFAKAATPFGKFVRSGGDGHAQRDRALRRGRAAYGTGRMGGCGNAPGFERRRGGNAVVANAEHRRLRRQRHASERAR